MKHSVTAGRSRNARVCRYNHPRYPNAADSLYFARKAQELLGGILFSAALSVTTLLLVMLS